MAVAQNRPVGVRPLCMFHRAHFCLARILSSPASAGPSLQGKSLRRGANADENEMISGDTPAEGWQGKDRAAKALRWLIMSAPVVVALIVSLVLNRVLPPPSSWSWAILRVAVIAIVSMASITIVERAGRRLLPLAMLLRLSLVFPDRTPSRFKLALKAGSGKRMERVLTEARVNGLSVDKAQAAEQLVLLSTAIGTHDRRTRGHSERVRLYAELLGEELHLSDDDRHKLQWAALIHDMGKITVPPEILNKKGKPSDAEWAILQNHPMRGEELVAPVGEWLGEWVHAVGGHHERWDGTGYPRKLAGHDIPRAAAIVAVADSFEVMTAVRSYKSAMSLADARAELTHCSGTHFSPEIVRAFLNVSLPKLRRAGGALASLAHVPFIGNALTASAKAPEAWGYALGNMANAGSTAVAAAAMTGVLIAAPATADSHHTTPPTAASYDSGQNIALAPASDRGASSPQQELIDAIIANTTPADVEPAPAPPPPPPETPPPTSTPSISTQAQPGPSAAQPAPATPAPTPPANSAEPPAPAPAPPAPTNPSWPMSIEQLLSMVQHNPDAYGEKGPDLLKNLQELQNERRKHSDTHDHVTERAEKTIDDAEKWMRQGKLNAIVVFHTKRLLTPLADQHRGGHHDDDD